VCVAGSSVPRHFFGRLHILCATLRMLVAAVCLLAHEPACDAVVADQVPAAVPLLRACGVPVLFYCHFPDKLLSTGGGARVRAPVRLLRWLYRLPFDILEELCTGCASRVLVNSSFTAGVYQTSFRVLRFARALLGTPPPAVLHPAIDLTRNKALPWPIAAVGSSLSPPPSASDDSITLVSINRFERKKALELALRALCELRELGGGASGVAVRVRLVLAGGYDSRLEENVEYYEDLLDLVHRSGMSDVVEFRRNVSDDERRDLLQKSACVVYTPSFEHFGIVPLEAMAAGRPVIAVNLGGPCESVVHGSTGWLCEPTPAAFASAFAEVLRLHETGELMERGRAARARVEAAFSLERFGESLDAHLRALCA
jgi:alpha-1,3/alpha-1,6-mannosyltransferase